MNINKKYVIKQATSEHYCSGIREWSPDISHALIFEVESNAVGYIINDKCTLEKGVRLLIIPVYNTI